MLLDGLNKEQRIVAETLEGPVLVLAGAGSGKTRAVTYRIAHLLENNVKPYQILALTFTNKAANEMKERIRSLVGEGSEQIWVYTFHSFCVRILRRWIEKLGYAQTFTIYDEDDQLSILKSIIKDKGLDDKIYAPKLLKSIISDAKNKLLTPDEWFEQSNKSYIDDKTHEIFLAYNKKLLANNALDFNDLLFKVIELLRNDDEVLEYYQKQFNYIHVDEYQDTNHAQYIIVKLLSKKHNNICVVGDDDQSIYGWRGADITNILNFEKDFANAQVIKLEQNYRSTSNILEAANAVIANNENRKDKTLWTDLGKGEKITIYASNDERGEAAWVCDTIKKLVSDGIKLNSIAILYRTNVQSRVMEEMLIRSKIAHQVFGSKRFYDRKEIKDVIAYLRILANPNDDISLKRIINQPKRSIGNATVEELEKYANEKDMPLIQTLYDIPNTLSSRPYKCVESFGELVTKLKESSKEMSLGEFAEYVVDEVGLIEQYKTDLSEEARNRIENIQELLHAINEFEDSVENSSLEAYLENISLVTDLDRASDDDQYVSLMTLHSAKGLEFDNVFIIGAEEGIFPSFRSSDEPDLMEEERRLCYVGITRAKRRLYITSAQKRTIYNKETFNKPSRFIEEIPKEYIDNSLNVRRETSFESLVTPKTVDRNVKKQRHSFGFDSSDLIIPGKNQVTSTYNFARQNGFIVNAKEITNNFNVGDRVDHYTYGEGNVVSINGSDKDGKIVVEFTAYGRKTFSLALAPLKKI